MKKNDNIFVKLQIEKDENSGELILNIRFDKETPNFFTDRDVISWCPTIEEIKFVNEAFELISKNKDFNQKKMNVKNKLRKTSNPFIKHSFPNIFIFRGLALMKVTIMLVLPKSISAVYSLWKVHQLNSSRHSRIIKTSTSKTRHGSIINKISASMVPRTQ